MRFSIFSLAVLCVAIGSGPVLAQQHRHDHGHAHGDHGHDHHASDHEGHDAEPRPAGLRLEVEAAGVVAAGQPVTLTLRLSGPDGTPLTSDDLTQTHGELLHVLIVDEGLEDYHHLHPQAGGAGVFTVMFTPQHPRIYQVWVETALKEPFEMAPETAGHDDASHHAHDHGDHDHGDHDHGDASDHGAEGQGDGDHAGHAGGAVRASAWVRAGDEAAPYILPIEELAVNAGDLAFTLAPQTAITAGLPVTMTLSVATADGEPVTALQPYLGAYAHIVGFNSGASHMAHTHPLGAAPLDEEDRAGPDLAFEISFGEPGVHRLFVQVRHEDDVILVPFTIIVPD